MADDKTTKTPEQPVTDSGPGKETPPAPPKEPEKVSVSPEPEKKTEPEVKNPQVSVYNFSEIMKEKKAEERAAAPGGEKPDPAKAEKPEKQPEAPKKAEEKPKEPEQPKRRGRPPKADKDKAAAPKPKAPAQKPEKAVKKEPEKKTAPTVQAAPAPKESEKPKDAPRRGLCTENGSEWVYPAHRPCTRKRADLSVTALFQQSQSGRRTRAYLWRVPGGNRRIEAGL